MNKAEGRNFLSDQHKSLTDDMNHVSDGLLKAKWFFLASIAALATGYGKIYDPASALCNSQRVWGLFFVCLVGNVTFWLLSEYALSHAFLFRFLQTRMARIEKLLNGVEPIKDPTDVEHFIDHATMRLKIDMLIPDQFVPIYWASTYLILISSIGGLFLARSYFASSLAELLWQYIAISLPFIWKLRTYYSYKMNKFIQESCHFNLVLKNCKNGKGYFDFSVFPWGWLVFWVAVWAILAFMVHAIDENKWDWLAVCFVGGYFFWVAIGTLIHLVRIPLRLDFEELYCKNARRLLQKTFTPNVVQFGNTYEVQQGRLGRIWTFLFIT